MRGLTELKYLVQDVETWINKWTKPVQKSQTFLFLYKKTSLKRYNLIVIYIVAELKKKRIARCLEKSEKNSEFYLHFTDHNH